MLPNEILEVVQTEEVIAGWKASAVAEPSDKLVHALVDWLLSPGAARVPAVRRYLFYLGWMFDTFHSIAAYFPRHNLGREGQKDSLTVLTTPEEMLYLANHLYILDSYGVEGVVLECGCFKGYSSCCLSHACAYLSRELFVADSFEGLPPPRPSEAGYYQPGDFAGSLDEVERNVAIYGRAESVRYVKGWFSDSLNGWTRPLALLWTDVDLYQSVLDVLKNVFHAVDPRAAMFSHEFLADYIHEGQIVFPHESPGAYRDFLGARDCAYAARYLGGHTAMIVFSTSLAPASAQLLNALMMRLYEKGSSASQIALLERQLNGLRAHMQAVSQGRVMRFMNAVSSRMGRR